MSSTQLSIAITGAGGAGVISCGELLLQAWGEQGGHGLLRKAYGPQIRGGEAASLVKLTDSERYTAAGIYDVIVALDWNNFTRFEDEIRIGPDTLVISEPADVLPDSVVASGAAVKPVPLAQLAAQAHADGRVNMLVLGILGGLLGLPASALNRLAQKKLAHKPATYQAAAVACIEQGMAQDVQVKLQPPPLAGSHRWCISGNQAAGLGALDAGVRFVAAYPITPASDVLEWMAGGLERLGGQLVQAEDELAAINMIIGAAYGGVPSFTATSGPGLALMTESIGLAVASETPVTVLNVMRGGPSTGIPTKSEQSDLNIALHGLHGDAPHLVFAPLDIADCTFTTGWAVHLAQHLQTAAIILSDQYIGQSVALVSKPRRSQPLADANLASDADGRYRRYEDSRSGISAAAVPGDKDRRFTADGLEHNQQGTPSAGDSDHQQQLAKRERKLLEFDFGEDWARISGSGTVAMISFGSTSAAVEEAAQMLADKGVDARVISLRLLAPLQSDVLAAALSGCTAALIVEQNHSGQLYQYLRGKMDFALAVHSYAVAGPVPLSADRIFAAVMTDIAIQ